MDDGVREGGQPQRPHFLLEPELLGSHDEGEEKRVTFLPFSLASEQRWRALVGCALGSRGEIGRVELVV